MQFAVPIPWWALVLLVAAVAAAAWGSYAGAIVALRPLPRAALSALRAMTLLVLVACLLRPVRIMPPEAAADAVVPILVDASRSMTVPDAGGRTRIDAARDLLQQQIQPALEGRFQAELWTFGSALTLQEGEVPAADQGRSDLSGALRQLRERSRGRRLAAVVLVSDGGDTGGGDVSAEMDDGVVPVFTVGVGSPRARADFEVIDVSAGEPALTDSTIDLGVAAVSRGAALPFDLRLLENGRPIDVRRVTPQADGSPVRMSFTVSPPTETATLYTVEIPSGSGELVLDNNRRSVLVEPPGRRRRVLIVEGAPGFEHTFLKRALAADEGLEIDSVVRKGRDARGDATFFVQATDARAPRLASGFPQDRAALSQYDALVLANVAPERLSRAQLEMAAGFVSERGGGLLLLGGRSFVQQGLVGTALDEVVPVGLADRGSGVVRTSDGGERYTVSVTPDGELHPVMRIAGTPEESVRRWRAVPALAGAAALGAPRPGAQVLAIVQAPDGPRPLVAVQRYGQGRAMIFTGEASWRWRMQLPSEDRTHERFWRQAVRWLSSGAPDPVAVVPVSGTMPNTTETLSVDVRDEAFGPVGDAQVTMRVTAPGGDVQALRPVLTDPRTGRYAAEHRFEQRGIYRVRAEARRGALALGSAERWILVGGVDLEMADPRLNEEVLRRIAAASGGTYLTEDDASQLSSLLAAAQVDPPPPQWRELWHTSWVFSIVIVLLAAEWVLRRHWGLR
ncbi:MAG: hypothetical protein HY657_17360 [Acidobacteria bacterium]|nr:hypothetical protein [Acidobacteriota bacterium]